MTKQDLYRSYDHRIKKMIIKSANPRLFPALNIPRSTALSWIRNGTGDIVTIPEFNMDTEELIQKNQSLRLELEQVKARERLSYTTFRIFGLQIQYRRLPFEENKQSLIEAIKKAQTVMPLKTCLETIGLTSARYFHWLKRQTACRLKDLPSCPKVSPTKLSHPEVEKIKKLVTSSAFAHFSIYGLATHMKRTGQLVASPSSWSRIIREFDLKRSRKRLYPAKRRTGIRSTTVNQLWHIDLSVIKLVDGTRCYIQAIMDNYSRFVIAHNVATTYGGLHTRKLIEAALARSEELTGAKAKPHILSDGGSENHNSEVAQLEENDVIPKLTIAQAEIDFSNSMIEALFSRLKNAHLYMQKLKSFDKLKRETDFYFKQSNEIIPHSALGGATPIEIFTGSWTKADAQKLAYDCQQAKKSRLVWNLTQSCGACPN